MNSFLSSLYPKHWKYSRRCWDRFFSQCILLVCRLNCFWGRCTLKLLPTNERTNERTDSVVNSLTLAMCTPFHYRRTVNPGWRSLRNFFFFEWQTLTIPRLLLPFLAKKTVTDGLYAFNRTNISKSSKIKLKHYHSFFERKKELKYN